MSYFVTVGILLGLSAGVAPGPLLTLVVSETLSGGVGAGVRVALSPLLSDLPIILFAVFFVSQFSEVQILLGAMSILGGFFVFYMGYESLRTEKINDDVLTPDSSKSLFRGVVTNLLNPHPYLFWFSVGAPTISKALSVSIVAPALFLFSFYICLVGAKVALAKFVGRSRNFLQEHAYIYTMRFLGVVLCLFAFTLLGDGFRLLGYLPSLPLLGAI